MAEGKCFHLEVVTPDRQFYIGDADSLVLPAIDGYMGVEAGHEPVVTAVVPGELKYRSEGAWTHAVVSQGLAEIMPDRVMVLTTSAERPEEIDLHRAEEMATEARAELNAGDQLRHHGAQADRAGADRRQGAGRGASAPEAEYSGILQLQGRAGPGHGPAEGGKKIETRRRRRRMPPAPYRFVTEARPAPPLTVGWNLEKGLVRRAEEVYTE